MKNITHLIIASVLGVLLSTTVGCRPDLEVFERPETLAGPIYEQLEAHGQFTYYLECLDKTSYAEPLATGGSWTIFAPTDSAFEQYFLDNGYTSVDDIPTGTVVDIIKYSVITSAYNTTYLTYYPNGWYAGNSFKKYTQYFDTLQVIDGAAYANVDGVDPTKDYLIDMSAENKTTNYWVDLYLDGYKCSAERSDYSFMFPGEEDPEVGDMKVFNAHVTEQEIIAENGFIYALDAVLEPQPSLYQNLSREGFQDKYSMFKEMLDRFGELTYQKYLDINPVTGAMDSVYKLTFQTEITENLLAFSPADETYPKLTSNVNKDQANAMGLLVPTNDALTQYLAEDNVISQNYESYDEMSLDVLGIFLNVNFFGDYWSVCPSHFGSGLAFNVGLDEVVIDESDVQDVKFCSNGLFVGVDKIYPTTTFSSVYGPLVLDTTYSIMLKCIADLGIENSLQSDGIEYSILGLRNDQFVNIPDPNYSNREITIIGYEPDMSVVYMEVTGDADPTNNRTYPDPTVASPSSTDIAYVQETLNDIIVNQIIEEPITEPNYYQTNSGEFVYVDGDVVKGGGDIYYDEQVNLTDEQVMTNGIVYGTDKFVNPPAKYTFGMIVMNYINYPSFLQFYYMLENAGTRISIPDDSYDFLISFLDLSKTYTCFIPSAEAVAQAVADGVIPNPMVMPTDEVEYAQAVADLNVFLKKHFLQHPIVTDGKTTGTFNSLNQTGVVDYAPVYSSYTIGNDYDNQQLNIFDPVTGEKVASTNGTVVNMLSKRVVMHEIDNYLK